MTQLSARNNPDEPYLSLGRVAQVINVSRTTLHKAVHSGRLPCQVVVIGTRPFHLVRLSDAWHWKRVYYHDECIPLNYR